MRRRNGGKRTRTRRARKSGSERAGSGKSEGLGSNRMNRTLVPSQLSEYQRMLDHFGAACEWLGTGPVCDTVGTCW
jgi:hypothetical protein